VKPWPWADTWPVARLIAPRLGIDRYVLAGANGSAIAFGPGHLSGTPVPGQSGNSVIGGHRDTHLAFLRHVKPGDELVVERLDGTRVAYQVRDALVLDKRDVWVAKQEGPSRLTLVTCFPFDALRAGGPQRYVVFAFESRNRGGERGTRG
jgi:sortase A